MFAATGVVAAIASVAIPTAAHAASASCTFTDGSSSATSPSAAPDLTVASSDTVTIACTGLDADEPVIIAQVASPVELDTTDAQQFTNVAHADLGEAADGSGNLDVTYKLFNFSNAATGAVCPQNQADADAGIGCVLELADGNTDAGLASVLLDYSNGATPTAAVLNTDSPTYSQGATVTMSGSHFYGVPVYGTPNAGVGIPAPTVLLDGTTPLTNAVTTSKASYTYNTGTPASSVLNPGGVLGGALSFSTSGLSAGLHSVTVIQANTTQYPGTTVSATATFHVTVPVPATHTTLAVTGNTTTGTDAALSGTVTPVAGDSGTVAFYDNGSSTPLTVTGGTIDLTTGNYSATLAGGFSAGSHSVVAKFTPSDPTAYGPSSSSPVAFSTLATAPAGSTCDQTGSSCTDTQTIEGTLPTGTLVISTPYTDASPLNVGTLALSTDGTYFTGFASFKCITVTDTTSGGSPFVASAVANTLTQVPGTGNPAQNTTNSYTTINGENVGLTGLAPSTGTCPDHSTPKNTYFGEASSPSSITASTNPAAQGVVPTDHGTAGLGNGSHVILTGSSGDDGTATYDGTLTLNAPTSTAAGTYKGTVIFTVTD
jgi:hypothetical protein